MSLALPESIQDYFDNKMSKHGWMDAPTKGYALAMHVLEHKPKIAVEIGVYSGRSLLTIALAMKENEQGLVIGIDPWNPDESIKGFPEGEANHEWWKNLKHSPMYEECLTQIDRLRVGDITSLRVQTSEQALSMFKENPLLILRRVSAFDPESAKVLARSEIDLLHIDGNHSVESALFDVTNWGQLVRSGGYIWLDDCDWLTTKPAQEKLDEIAILDYMVGTCGVYMKI